MLRDLFEGIAWLFEHILFIPYDALRKLQLDSWWGANMVNWIFILIGMAAFVYWMLQLKKFHEDDKENRRHHNVTSDTIY